LLAMLVQVDGRKPAFLAITLLGVVLLTLLAVITTHSPETELENELRKAQDQLNDVRGTMLKMQTAARRDHKAAAAEAQAAAKDRRLEHQLAGFAKVRKDDARASSAQVKAAQAQVKNAASDINSLKTNIASATKLIHTYSLEAQHALASNAPLHQDLEHVKRRLDELAEQHKFLSVKAALLTKGALPSAKRYEAQEEQVRQLELQSNKLRAEAHLYKAQAKVIGDNLAEAVARLRADQKTTTTLKAESDKLPPSTIKLSQPKFVSLAAQAKALYHNAGSALKRVKQDDTHALKYKGKLILEQKKIGTADQKAAALDLAAARLQKKAQRFKFLRDHLEGTATTARQKAWDVLQQEETLMRRHNNDQAKLSQIGPKVNLAKQRLKAQAELLQQTQVKLDKDRALAARMQSKMLKDSAKVKSDVKASQRDITLSLGAKGAARVHEARAAALANQATGEDKRVDKLTSELEASDQRVRSAESLEDAAAHAKQQLAALSGVQKKAH